MRFKYHIENKGKFKITCNSFAEAIGIGDNESEAFAEFITSVFQDIRQALKEDLTIPEERPSADNLTFGLPLNMSLKLKLHNLRLKLGVSKSELAHFLSLTYEDVGDDDWNVDKLRTILSSRRPKYKNVQRLFSLDHESTVREVEQAYRVLGYTVEVFPREKALSSSE